MTTSGVSHRNTPESATLMARVARKYYMGNMTKKQIGEELYLSRFKVARLLEDARAVGIVEISVGLPGNRDEGLARELEDAFALRRAVVVEDPGLGQFALFSRLGVGVVDLLTDILQPGDSVGIASTRSMMNLREPDNSLPKVSFVQLTGELPRKDASNVISGIRTLTRAADGDAHVFYAPMIATSEQLRQSYLRQTEVATALERTSDLDVFVTGLGAWKPGLSVIYDHMPDYLRKSASEEGAVAELLGVPIDRDGGTVHCAARRRVLAPNIELVAGAREKVAVAFDSAKSEAVKLALGSGLVNGIVTHREVAEALLADPNQRPDF